MKRALLGVIVSSTALLAIVACSSTNGASEADDRAADGGPAAVSPDDASGSTALELQYATALCARIQRCSPASLAVLHGDAAGCVTRKAAALQPVLNAGSVGDLRTQVTTCASALAARACDGDYTTVDPACVFTGTLANGTACTHGSQCATGSCAGSVATDCGRCAPFAEVGADCSTAECAVGSYCTTSSNTCIAYKKVGEACGLGETDALCVLGAACEVDTCVKVPGPGEACDGFCQSDYQCDEATKQCVENKRAALGQKCGTDYENLVFTSCTNGFCAGDVDNNDGICTAWVQAGGACDDAFGSTQLCDDGLQCVVGTCARVGRPTTCQ